MRRESWLVPWSGRVDPRVVDAVMAFSVAAVSVLSMTSASVAGYRAPDAGGYLLIALVDLPLLARRRVPVAVLWFCCSLYAVYLALGYIPTALLWAPVLALYTLAALRQGRVVVTGAVGVAAVVTYSGVLDPFLSTEGAVLQGVVVTSIALALGIATGKLAERNRQLAEATEALRREQRARTERAVTEERLRIARELHDVVAHHMSVISVQSGLADYVLDDDPRTAHGALHTIGETTREALEEMRRLLSLLRLGPEPPDGDGAFGLADLDALATRVRAAGLPVEVTVAGLPRPLPPGVDLCAYRVIQEALTNTLKHAGPCEATVHVRYHRNQLTTLISDTGNATGPADNGRAGHGLVGMRERAKLYGGTLAAGPGPVGGFEVELTLPLPDRPATR